jgi:hypothetical protein
MTTLDAAILIAMAFVGSTGGASILVAYVYENHSEEAARTLNIGSAFALAAVYILANVRVLFPAARRRRERVTRLREKVIDAAVPLTERPFGVEEGFDYWPLSEEGFEDEFPMVSKWAPRPPAIYTADGYAQLVDLDRSASE